MPHEVVYVSASSTEPNTTELTEICREMEAGGYTLLHVAAAQSEGGLTTGLWLFFSDADPSPPASIHFDSGSFVSSPAGPEFGPMTFAGETSGGQASALWRDIRAKKGLGASLTVTGLAAVLLGIVLHFALRSDLIGTALHLGYFFGLIGLFLFLIGLLIVF